MPIPTDKEGLFMIEIPIDVNAYAQLAEAEQWSALGRVVREQRLGVLPEEEDQEANDAVVGEGFFRRQLISIRRIYCIKEVAELVKDEQRRNVVEFVATFLDLFAAYFGGIAGAMILVQIHKIGVNRFCTETPPGGGQSGIAPTSAGTSQNP